MRLERVAYVPDLAFNLFSLMATHTRGVGFATDDSDKSVTLLDGRLRFWSDGTEYSTYGRRIDPDDVCTPSPSVVPGSVEDSVQPDPPVPLAFPVIAPGSADSRETAVDINVFHCTQGHASEFLLRETAKSLGIELLGDLKPCTGCSMAKGYRKPIASSTKSRASKKLGRVFTDLSGPKQTPS